MSKNLLLKKILLLSFVCSVFCALPWIFPDTFISSLTGFIAVFTLIFLMQNTSSCLFFFLTGVIAHCLGFFWLFNTIHEFGQFNYFLSLIGFLIFASFSSIQFLLLPLIYKFLKKSSLLRSLALPATLSFILTESFYPKLFPWRFGHTQLYFKSLSLNASIGGVVFISFVMFWFCEFLMQFFNNDSRINIKKISYLSPFLFIILLINGNHLLNKKVIAPTTKVSVVQAIPFIEPIDGMKIIRADVEKYTRLTNDLISKEQRTLVVWPESAITNWIHEPINDISEDKNLPFFGNNYPLVTGALSFIGTSAKDQILFNSVFLIGKNGEIYPPYHKQILIPFGEYIPFSNIFPFLKKFLNMESFFSRGNTIEVFNYTDTDNNQVKISPFICYEELIPSLFSKANRLGANLFVGLSDDAWFGKGVALFQHNLISSFRAIENNRFFVRSTHTGLSAIIDNKGFIVKKLPTLSNAYMTSDVSLIEDKTLYSFVGDIPLYLLNFFTFIILLINIFKKSENI